MPGSSFDSHQVDVFGVAMGTTTDYQTIRGVKGVDEPCLRGFERSFDKLDIVVGYGRDGKIRKIITRNPQNSLFGVHPGEALTPALVRIHDAGFIEDGTPCRFNREGYVLTILNDGNGRLFGMILEASE